MSVMSKLLIDSTWDHDHSMRNYVYYIIYNSVVVLDTRFCY